MCAPEDKTKDLQLELLKIQIGYLEYYKSLRIRIPFTVVGIQLATTAFVVEKILHVSDGGSMVLVLHTILASIGLASLALAHEQYDNIVDEIHHLYSKLGMIEGNEYFLVKPAENRLGRATGVFFLGYCSILIMGFISAMMSMSALT